MIHKLRPIDSFTCPRASRGQLINAMTVDVEDYYHAHALGAYFTRDTWPNLERRVLENTKRILDSMDEHDTKGTFFTLGSVAVEYPELIKDIVGRGHELASHGMEHYRADDQDHKTFLQDVKNAKAALEDASGTEIKGYRAASFSISAQNWWAFDALEEAGYSYSSSISAKHHKGQSFKTPSRPFYPGKGDIVECPISVTQIMTRTWPTGGGYFRLVPYSLFRPSLESFQKTCAQPAIFYYHPWEIDPLQPRAKVNLKTKFRHLVNIRKMDQKVAKLLQDFHWAPMKEVFQTAFTNTHGR